MTEPIVTDRELAQALLATEMACGDSDTAGAQSRNGDDAAAALANGERVLQKLQEHLLGWFGPDGVDALLVRALERTRMHHPLLAGVQRAAPGTLRLAGMIQPAPTKDRPDGEEVSEGISEAILALLAAILALIGRLVGDDMVRHLLEQIWPGLPGAEPSSNDSPNNNERSGK